MAVSFIPGANIMQRMVLLSIGVVLLFAVGMALFGRNQCPATNMLYIDEELAQLETRHSLLFETTDDRLGVLGLLELGEKPTYRLRIDGKNRGEWITNRVSKANLIFAPHDEKTALFVFVPRGTIVFNPGFIRRVALLPPGRDEHSYGATNEVTWTKVVHNAM